MQNLLVIFQLHSNWCWRLVLTRISTPLCAVLHLLDGNASGLYSSGALLGGQLSQDACLLLSTPLLALALHLTWWPVYFAPFCTAGAPPPASSSQLAHVGGVLLRRLTLRTTTWHARSSAIGLGSGLAGASLWPMSPCMLGFWACWADSRGRRPLRLLRWTALFLRSTLSAMAAGAQRWRFLTHVSRS